MRYDAVVIGSGPAGMSAAITLSKNGATVAVVDENPVAGGKLLAQLHQESKNNWWIGKDIAHELEKSMKQLNITIFQNTEVWGIFPKWRVLLNNSMELQTNHVLIASGAVEKAIPIPGWTIPGVMAIGAAQMLTNYHRVKPGKKVAIIGIDPLSLITANELKTVGVDVVGIFIPPPIDYIPRLSSPKSIISYLSTMAHLAPSPLLKLSGKLSKTNFIQTMGARYYPRNGVKVWGIPLHLRKTVIEIKGENQVEQILIANVNPKGRLVENSQYKIDVDCVCISGGLYPLVELAAAAKCDFVYIEELGGHVPLYSPEMETTQQGIYVAGNCTGIEGAKIAMAQGELAGVVISQRLGLIQKDSVHLIKQAQEKVKKTRRNSTITFQQHIEIGRDKADILWNKHFKL